MFDCEKVQDECVCWIRDFFEQNGKDCNAVIGISGGKDSSVTADLCVKALGTLLGLPENLIQKTPIDGLSGKSDEENLGFSYAVLDKYIRTGICDDMIIKQKIDMLHRINRFKLEPLPCFKPTI